MKTVLILSLLLFSSIALAEACQTVMDMSAISKSMVGEKMTACHEPQNLPEKHFNDLCKAAPNDMLKTKVTKLAKCPGNYVGKCFINLKLAASKVPTFKKNKPKNDIPDNATVTSFYYDAASGTNGKMACIASSGKWTDGTKK